MGKRGPAPKPTRLRLVDGDKKNRINTDEPVARQGAIEPPGEMSPEVRAVWDRVVAELDAMQLASPADVDSLRCFCEAVVDHERASAVLAKSNVVIKGLHGGLVRNPAVVVQLQAAETIRKFAQEFGLTPSGRTRIRVEEATGRAYEPANNPYIAAD